MLKIAYFVFQLHAAEDWLKPAVILEAFEARAIRMSVSCAKDLSKFASPEEGGFVFFGSLSEC